MGAYGVSLANRRIILLAVLSLIASLLAVSYNAPQAGAIAGDVSFEFVSISDSTAETGTYNVQVQLTVDGGGTVTGSDATVQVVDLLSGSAADTIDYTTPVLKTLTWSIGESGTIKSLVVTILPDSVDEGPDETIDFQLQNPTGQAAALGTNQDFTLSITEDDTAGVTVDVGTGVNVVEGGPTDTYSVVLTSEPTGTVTVTPTPDAQVTTSGAVTFDAGDWNVPKFITVTAVNDLVVEGPHTGAITHSASGGGYDSVIIAGVTANITDNDSEISVNDVAVDEEAGTLDFTVTRTGVTTTVVTFNYATSEDTATNGVDYTDVSGIGTIGTTETSTTISVPILGDTIDEADEEFTISLSGAVNATIVDGLGTGTITDNDDPPTVEINDVTVDEDGVMSFTITRTGGTSSDVTVTANSTDGTADFGADYTRVLNQVVTIPASPTTATAQLPVALNNEPIYELDETFTIALSAPNNATLGAKTTGLGTIGNDDAAPVLTISDESLPENGGTMTFTVTRTGPTEVAATVLASTANGTAAAPGDFGARSNVLLTIPAGLTPDTTTIGVAINDDVIDEVLESFTMVLSGPLHATLGTPSTGTGLIVDDDGEPNLLIDDVTVTEGGIATFTVTKVGTTEKDVVVHVLTGPSNPAEAVAGNDYFGSVDTLTILAAETEATFSVSTIDDDIDEDDERFLAIMNTPTNALLVPGAESGTATIIDNDDQPVVSINDVTVDEAAGVASFTVTRTGLTERIVEVTAQTADDSAAAGSDYLSKIDTVSIAPGGASAAASFVVGISEDFRVEGPETFDVDLSAAVNATIGDGTGQGTITDNDVAGVTITQTDGSTVVIEGGTTDSYTVVLTAQPTADVIVNIAPDAQVSVSTLNLTFTESDWNTPRTVTVAAVEDGVDEVDPHPGLIEHTTTSADTNFNALTVASITPSIGDADALLVEIEGPSFGAPGYTSTFSAMVTAGAVGTITYEWIAFSPQNKIVQTGNQATFTFTPTEGGIHRILATVGDDDGQNPTEFIPFTVLGDIEGNTFVEDIIWLAEEGVTRGCNPPANDNFCPARTVTRGQMAAFLVRFLGLTDIDSSISFTDTAGNTFEQDILKLATAGITRGCNADGTAFCPNRGVTRGQMAAFLVRAFNLTDDGGGDLFTDDDNSIFEADIDKLATAGITRGCNPPTNSNFCPDRTVTRGQMAAFLHRAEGLVDN